MNSSRWIGCAAALLLAAPLAADTIVLRDGTRINGAKVTSESASEVKYTASGGAPGSVTPGTKVRTILRDEVPEGLERGQGYLRSGDYRTAALELEEIAKAGGNTWVAEYAYMSLGDAKRMRGIRENSKAALRGAIEAYASVLTANPSSRFIVEVHLSRGLCQRLLGKYDAAISAYEEAKGAASGNNLGAVWVHRAGLGAAWAMLEKKDVAGAASAFDSIASGASGAEAREALSGWSEAALAQGKIDDVRNRMSSKLTATDPEDRAVGHNGVGAALFKEGKFADARRHFVKVVALYFANPAEHARALYYAGECYVRLKEADATRYRATYWKELKSRYPTSSWALRAR